MGAEVADQVLAVVQEVDAELLWKSAQMRRMLAEAGLVISAGKMSSWWAGTPPTMRLEELDVLCTVLECSPTT